MGILNNSDQTQALYLNSMGIFFGPVGISALHVLGFYHQVFSFMVFGLSKFRES